jgi:hypothetical protein
MLADDRLSGALSELAHSSWEIQCFSVFCIDATPLILVFSAFSIDGRPDLSLVVYKSGHTEGCEQDLRINKILVQDLTVPATVAEVDGTRWVHFLGRFTNQPSRYC